MIIEMGGDRSAFHIVGRMLDRAEIKYLLMLGNDHDPARMLSRGALNPGATNGQAVFLSLGDHFTLFFKILLHESVGGFLGQCADGARTEYIPLAEELFGVFMGD
ncbi:hypothetical protein SDC9_208144 [bioreactor metagenome]|uniref:Uncharacterized protein n=1 Tax=bioreactor metagenome TaxID=1076179 RepID=A0A645JAG6_9ZZZZ